MDDLEIVDVVDEEDKIIGKSSRKEAHKKGHIHRALSVLVLNSKGQILLQKRSKNKSVHPLSWDLSTSEHVLAGESYEDAGIRSVKEELGVEVEVIKISDTTLQIRKYEIGEEIIHEKEIVLMLSAKHEGPFKIEEREVDSVNFFSTEEIEKMIKDKESFTVWFLEEWENIKRAVNHNNQFA
jgi:isopentenyl-diphosphate delta-isomerase type 1